MTEQSEIEYNSLTDIPLPPGRRGLEKLKRHLRQLRLLFSSNRYRSYENLLKGVKESYSTPTEVEFWHRAALFGLEEYEFRALRDARESSSILREKEQWDCLMIGCGAGREAFGLEKLGHNVVATDISEKLLEIASEIKNEIDSRVEFYNGSIPKNHDSKTFDLIFVTNALLNLLPGRANRINFLKEVRSYCHTDTRILFFADVEPLNPRNRLFWISQVLRLKKIIGLGDYESGDVVSSSLGNWAGDDDPILFHYFPSNLKFQSELSEAKIEAEHKWGIFWLGKGN